MKTARQLDREAKALWRLVRTNGSVDRDRVRTVCDSLATSRRASALPLLKRLLHMLKLDRTRHCARVESAAPLDDRVREAVAETLARRYGSDVTTAFVVDPSLIGGVRVAIGGDVYDGSVRGALKALETRLER